MTDRMSRMNRRHRRKVRRRKSPDGSRKASFLAAIGIIFAAVLLGFLTARFVIGPIIGYNADISPVILKNSDDLAKSEDEQNNNSKEKNSSSDPADTAAKTEQNNEDNQTVDRENSAAKSSFPIAGEEKSYALQFGAFSDKEAAEKLKQELEAKGIETQIKEQDGRFKVISAVIKEKEEALKALDESKEKEITDVFIASS